MLHAQLILGPVGRLRAVKKSTMTADSPASPQSPPQPKKTELQPAQDATVPVTPKLPRASRQQADRRAVPSAAVQQAVGQQVDDVYRLSDSRSPREQTQLAQKLSDVAGKSDKPEERFVLLRKAAELTSEAGDVDLMFEILDRMGDYWDDADRWIRNQFAEGQLLRADWAYRIGPLALLSDGRLYGDSDNYVGSFIFDPRTDKATLLGRNQGLAPYTYTVCGDKLSATGYPGGADLRLRSQPALDAAQGRASRPFRARRG